jgi:hypothetical protein
MFYVLDQGWLALLFGNGVGGYEAVWNGAMPHNDFILILVDFGLLPLIVCLCCVVMLVMRMWRGHSEWFVMLVVVVLRLSWENNIYSYYLVSAGCMFFSMIFGAVFRARREAAR